jgi:type 2 lantibiotic biosynthesis protein LanM
MNGPIAFDPAWCGALTLKERLQTLKTAPAPVPVALGYDASLAAKRLERWQQQRPFDAEETFAERLASEQLSEAELLRLLGEPITAVAERLAAPPAWLESLTRATTHPTPPVLQFGHGEEAGSPVRFLHLVEPLLSQGLQKVRAGLWVLARGTAEQRPFDPQTIERVLLGMLPDQVLGLMYRTLVLELNVARLQGQLAGESPAARFNSFVERLKMPEVAAGLLKEYPVLSRQISQAVDQWATMSLEFMRHLCADWKAIKGAFRPGVRRDLLVEVSAGGDRHHEGRTVIIATFASGWKVVYKPRSLQVDRHMQALLRWLNQRGATPPFRLLTVLDRGNHGWLEFVKAEACQSEAELQRFYRRQGAYLALLYALQATDFHYENLIAAGEHPVLIDLESLFHPRDYERAAQQAEESAGERMAYSVLRVGLLPQRLWGDAHSEGIEISGLGGAAGQKSPKPVPTLSNMATDEMQVVREYTHLEGGQNRPTLKGAEVEVTAYTEDLVQGFAGLYRLLVAHRDALLAPKGPLAAFAEDEVRVILRPTRLYGLLLQESNHPDFLRNALDRDRFFDRLWVEAVQRPALKRVIASERSDLWRGDIPIFTTRPTARHLWDSAGRCIHDFFHRPSLELVMDRLGQLDEPDLARQEWFIRASLTTLSLQAGHTQWRTYTPAPAESLVASEAFLAAARRIGDQLATLAFWGEGQQDATWIGLSLAFNRDWMLAPMGPDLYSGTAGMALFFAYLGHLTGEERYTTIAQAARRTMQRQVDEGTDEWLTIGGFGEIGGAVYTLTHLATLWQDETLLDAAVAIAGRIPAMLPNDSQLDVVGGAAGALLAVLGLYEKRPLAPIRDIAERCGAHLVARVTPMATGVGWLTPASQGYALCGFSHGNAGIAAALFALAAVTGDDSYRETACAALAYERSQFVTASGNWPDLRHGEVGEHVDEHMMIAWCHGAPGVGLGRLRTLAHYSDATIHAEIEAALSTTLNHGFGMNHSLCHGDLGNLDLLLQAGLTLNDPRWQAHAAQQASAIYASIEREGLICGVPLGVETPGLLTGLAGIGYELLRIAAPAQVPSLLMLQPPL